MKFLKSNWREVISVIVFVGVLFAGILALGTSQVSESSGLSAAISLAVTLLGGVAKFVVCLALAWAGLAITFPEAARFTFGSCFDAWWTHSTQSQKGYVSITAAAVLAVVAALCMASS